MLLATVGGRAVVVVGGLDRPTLTGVEVGRGGASSVLPALLFTGCRHLVIAEGEAVDGFNGDDSWLDGIAHWFSESSADEFFVDDDGWPWIGDVGCKVPNVPGVLIFEARVCSIHGVHPVWTIKAGRSQRQGLFLFP